MGRLTRYKHSMAHGHTRAAQGSVGLLDPAMRDVLWDFKQLNTDEARAAFADKWLRLTSARLTEAWPMVYELLRCMRDHQWYTRQELLDKPQHFETFAAYFETILGKPFAVWGELEATYHFVAAHAPCLFHAPLPDAEAARRKAVTDAKAVPLQKQKNPAQETRDALGRYAKVYTNTKDINFGKGGTSQSYRLRRLARDHKDILARYEAGEFRSVQAACIAAGFVKPRTRGTGAVKGKTSFQRLRAAWNKATAEDRQHFLRWLKEQDAYVEHQY